MSQAEMAVSADSTAGSRQTIAGTCARRTLLAGAGLAAATLALPAMAALEPDAGFWAKWRAWKQIDVLLLLVLKQTWLENFIYAMVP